MKRSIIFLLLTVQSITALERLPDEFTVVERFISLTETFDLSTELGPFALAKKRFFSLTSAFDLFDERERPLASAKARFFAWGTVADVSDPEGSPIGTIEEVVWRILPWAEYTLFNAEKQPVAVARMNFWGTHFDLFPPDDPERIYATIERPFVRIFRDQWTVRIFEPFVFEEKIIDPRLLAMLTVYQTDKDNRDRIRKEIIDQIRHEIDAYDGTRSIN